MPGRPKKPILLHKLQGTARADRMAKRAGELQLPPSRPEPPDWLLPEAKEEWGRLFRASEYAACLAVVDRGILAIWCQLWAQWVESQTSCKEFGGRQLMALMQAGRVLGLNPQDRTKIKTAAPTEKADDPWEKLG